MDEQAAELTIAAGDPDALPPGLVEPGGPGDSLGPDRQSFADFYTAQYPSLVRLAFLLCGSKAVAEDLVQDALAKMCGRWAAIERPGAYARTSVVNGWRGALRRKRVAERSMIDRPEPVIDGPLLELRGALDRLPRQQRAVIVLRFYCDLPDAEIAQTLGCRPATVRSLAHRGLFRLREVIEL